MKRHLECVVCPTPLCVISNAVKKSVLSLVMNIAAHAGNSGLERFLVARLARNDNDCKYPRDWPHTHEQEGFPDTLPSLLPSFKGITFFPDSAGSVPETLDTAGFLKIAKDLSDHVPTSARAGGFQPAQREGA